MVTAAFVIFLAVARRWYVGSGWNALTLIMYANFNLLVSMHRIALVCFPRNNQARAFVDSL